MKLRSKSLNTSAKTTCSDLKGVLTVLVPRVCMSLKSALSACECVGLSLGVLHLYVWVAI